MELNALIEQAKKLGESLQANIQKSKEQQVQLEGKIKDLDRRTAELNDLSAKIAEREKKVAKIESAQALLAKAEQRNLDANQKQGELDLREKKLAEHEAKLADDQKKVVRDAGDLEIKRNELKRDWEIVNKQKKEIKEKLKLMKA